MHKARGMVRDVFRTRNMRALPGDYGIGQVRYPTAGNAESEEEAQPFYVNAPFGLVLAHNGNLINAVALKRELFNNDHRHINTESDTEVLINVLAHEIERRTHGLPLSVDDIFAAVRAVHLRLRGSYAVVALIAGHGLLAFRDPFGIRPLCFGTAGEGGEVMVASESVALEGTGYKFERDIAPGEAIFVDLQGRLHSQQCAAEPQRNPCIFEYVYLARPRLCARRRVGLSRPFAHGRNAGAAGDLGAAAQRDRCGHSHSRIQPAVGHATRAQAGSAVPRGFRQEPLCGANLHHARTGGAQEVGAAKAQRHRPGIRRRNVLLVDDSIVRGTTSREIVQMAREAGRARCIWRLPRRRCAIPISTASTCPRPRSWWRTTAVSRKSARSSAPMC
jgi:amidophosphoribosyltransferase (EC 2.4.2.14)